MSDENTAPDSEPLQVEPVPEPDAPVLPVMTTTPVSAEPPAPHSIKGKIKTESFDFNPPSEGTQLRIQEALTLKDLYPYKHNGKWGYLTVYAIAQSIGSHSPAVNYAFCEAISEFASEVGGYDGEPTPFLTEEIWEAYAQGLEQESN